MPRLFFRSALAALAALAAFASVAQAARQLVSVDYFCPVTFQLTCKRELPTVETSKGTSNAVAVTRLGNRDLLLPVVAERGGKLSDWSIVAYSNSDTLEKLGDLALVARRKNGDIHPLGALDLTTLNYLSVNSNAYAVVRDPSEELVRATFDQLYVVTWEHALAGGSFLGNGTATNTLVFGPVKVGNRSLRAHKPKVAKLLLNGIYTPAGEAGAVAELSIKIGAPKLVPHYSESTGTGGVVVVTPINPGGVGPIVITPINPGSVGVSPN